MYENVAVSPIKRAPSPEFAMRDTEAQNINRWEDAARGDQWTRCVRTHVRADGRLASNEFAGQPMAPKKIKTEVSALQRLPRP